MVNIPDDESDTTISENPIVSESEAVIGRLLHMGSRQAPHVAKSWFALAGWCYKWGRKAIESAM